MADLPSAVDVAAIRYTIVVDLTEAAMAAHDAQLRWLYGVADHRNERIVLHPDQGPSQLRDTLLHEVLHCVASVAGGLGEDEEAIVAQLSRTLLDTLRRNPGLVTFLLAEES